MDQKLSYYNTCDMSYQTSGEWCKQRESLRDALGSMQLHPRQLAPPCAARLNQVNNFIKPSLMAMSIAGQQLACTQIRASSI
jgi:hypothetical protein